MRNHYQTVLGVFLMLSLLLTLTACGSKKDHQIETVTSATESRIDTIPTEAPTETTTQADTQPTDTEPTTEELEPTETTTEAEATEPIATIDPNLDLSTLVTDAYSVECVINECPVAYHIPRINLGGSEIQALNDDIYTKYYTETVQPTFDYLEKNEGPGTSEVSYKWAINGDVLSLHIRNYNRAHDFLEQKVYNVSISLARPLTPTEVLEKYPIDQEEYTRRLKEALITDFMEKNAGRNYFQETFYEIEVLDKLLFYTLHEESLNAAIPYINEEGHLCALAIGHTPAGAGFFYVPLDLVTYELTEHYDFALSRLQN